MPVRIRTYSNVSDNRDNILCVNGDKTTSPRGCTRVWHVAGYDDPYPDQDETDKGYQEGYLNTLHVLELRDSHEIRRSTQATPKRRTVGASK